MERGKEIMAGKELHLYNSLTRRKELFTPLVPQHVGMYVCGPTVYGDPHLGHARAGITFDLLYRVFLMLGYKVRYVRNITDVGHLEFDADDGEDKIAKRARLEQLEPMEIAHRYTERYHEAMRALGVLSPSIEPRATGHMPEQIELISRLIELDYAYESEGNVYFDIEKYNAQHNYGILSGRNLEDMQQQTRTLQGQSSKRNPLDFALWKSAQPEHIMRWKSPWSDGFPGWHLECTAMGRKYLGDQFDIHGGGMDLMFPHHECEIAQGTSLNGVIPARYWVHNNMITINGQKMGKSLGNYITLDALFAGNHDLLTRAYHPMVIRFFILQAHYRSTLDFSDEALDASRKGLERFHSIASRINTLQTDATQGAEDVVNTFVQQTWEAILDDLNSPVAIAHFFELSRTVAKWENGEEAISKEALRTLQEHVASFYGEVLGLSMHASSMSQSASSEHGRSTLEGVMDILLDIRLQAKKRKDYALSDTIREKLDHLGIEVQDAQDKSQWRLKE